MATPVVETTSTGTSDYGTSHAITLPSGIVAGDLLLVFLSFNTTTTISSWSGSFTELYDANDSSTVGGAGAYKVAAGSDTLTATSAGSTECVYACYRLSGQHASSAPEAGTAASGYSNTPDPPSLTPSWGSETTLWIAITHGDVGTVTTAPANYTNIIEREDFGSPNIGTARRALTAASDNPGTWAVSATDGWVAQTVAIRPAAAGGRTTKNTRSAPLGIEVGMNWRGH